MKLKEDDIVLCKVKKIEKTSVFLDIEDNGEGSMMMSEVAAGRIRNLRNYVSLNKQVVCKVLKISGDHIELSLRRVTSREKEEVLERYRDGRALSAMLKSIGEDAEKVIGKIKEKYNLSEFVEEARKNPEVFKGFIDKKNVDKIGKVLLEKVSKEKKVVRKFVLKSDSENGLKDIKEILDVDGEIHYLGSGVFSISCLGEDFKEANNKLERLIEEIEKRAKAKKSFLEIKGK